MLKTGKPKIIIIKNGTVWCYNAVMQPKVAAEMTKSGDSEQTAPLGLHCLLIYK